MSIRQPSIISLDSSDRLHVPLVIPPVSAGTRPSTPSYPHRTRTQQKHQTRLLARLLLLNLLVAVTATLAVAFVRNASTSRTPEATVGDLTASITEDQATGSSPPVPRCRAPLPWNL